MDQKLIGPKADVVSTNAVTVLENVRRGQFLYDLSSALEELVASVREHKRGGSVTVKLSLDPMNPGDGDTLQLSDEIMVKKPKPTRAKSIFFSTKQNTLVREDPRQRTMDL